jgi:hypothetical protein
LAVVLGLTTPPKRPPPYKMLHRVSELDSFFGTNLAAENGHEILNLGSQEFLNARFFGNSIKKINI